MNIGIYNPYFDSLAGGERYCFTLASHWSKKHSVSIFWDDKQIVEQAKKRFFLDLGNVRVSPNIFRWPTFQKLFASRAFDLIFVLSDGSIPTTFARHNILHFQMPFPRLRTNALALSRYDAVVCNSHFTESHMDPRLREKMSVIYPPVDVKLFQSKSKEKLIVSVGRFTNAFQAKKQEVLIDAFTKGYVKGKLNGWRFVLIGGLLPSDRAYFENLQKRVKGLPIELIPNASFERLKDLYAKATLYWHAAGFGETNPQHAEHFGITTVEAMAARCLPLVYNAGGQPEIVRDHVDGFVWNTTAELLMLTKEIIDNRKLADSLRESSHQRAQVFDVIRFCDAFDKLLYAYDKKNHP